MNTRASSITPGTEPIPGYVLRKRLGAGGYGEVWLADAPGGLKKAIKLIYGNVDESRASAELKSLERIRSANHPFLLSIERIEIVDGKVIIVTELASSSLQDRFESCRRQGLPGIPRTEVLDFLGDAADALDFLAQKHSLQHLDVKPGNLLIVADRIKVADFGLVKDLQDTNQSLVGGLTPTYSAPEVFDGRPDFRSDQYSLAIVFMEMLTGQLPFKGISPGDLARQHLNHSPNLEPLPPADRVIIGRALEKNPLDRYTTCRQLIDQLLKVRSSILPVFDSSERSKATENDSTLGSTATHDTNNWVEGPSSTVRQAIAIDKKNAQYRGTRALFIGLGGQGVLALRELRHDLIHNVDDRLGCDDHQWMAIDTNCSQLEFITSGDELTRFPREDAIELPVDSPHSYRKCDPELFTPISRRWLYNIPRSQTTEGVRPIATLCLIAHYPQLCRQFERRLEKLVQLHQEDHLGDTPLRIYVLASAHGATGAGLMAEIGMLARNTMSKLGFKNYRLCATLSVATTRNHQDKANLASANAIALMSELLQWMDPTSERPHLDYRGGYRTTNLCPFDWVTLVDGGLFDEVGSQSQNPRNLARTVSLDCQTAISSVLAELRKDAKQSSPVGWLRTSCTATINDLPKLRPEQISQCCAMKAIQTAGDYLTGSITQVSTETGHNSSSSRPLFKLTSTSLEHIPLPDEACNNYSSRLIAELGFLATSEEIFKSEEVIVRWARRLSDSARVRSLQLSADLFIWQKTLFELIEGKQFTWPQVTRIQLQCLEKIQAFNQHYMTGLIRQFEGFSGQLGEPIDMYGNAHRYLVDLAGIYASLTELLQKEAREVVQHLNQCWQFLNRSMKLNDPIASEANAICRHVPVQFESVTSTLADRLTGRLLRTVDSCFALLRIEPPRNRNQAESPEIESIENERQLFQQSNELVLIQLHSNTNSEGSFQNAAYFHNNLTMQELPQFLPTLATGGGEVDRLVVSSPDQMDHVAQSLDSMGLAAQTTLVAGPNSLGVQVLCEASQLIIPHLVTSLWRPSGATLSLAERLRTRTDIDWNPVGDLLDRKLNQPSGDLIGKGGNASPNGDSGNMELRDWEDTVRPSVLGVVSPVTSAVPIQSSASSSQ